MTYIISSKSLLLTAVRHLEWITEELPPLSPQSILVQTRAGAISIGSELPQYTGTASQNDPTRYPRMTGYESIGTVMACGPAVQHLHPGDRVIAFYGHRTHAVVPEMKSILVPGDISDPLALLTILTCDAAKGVRKVAPKPEEAVLITGAGAMGLLTLFILKAYGIVAVDMVEPRVERHTLARRLGARNVLLPQDVVPTSKTYSVAFECSSRNEAFALLQNQVQENGRICITSDGNLEPLELTPAFHQKELQLVGTSDGWDYHQHAAWFFQEVQQRSTPLEQLFEVQVTSRELISTFEQLAIGAIQPVKIQVSYGS
ncbi:MAG TPA: alcohol dehydrogenase catalytic domain-containing protein [Ktedonobacteraceae bacterium]|nr:alcohol dehydrogenase catalytic domain-containing protein [Ktedonobacteraceae bacterium]